MRSRLRAETAAEREVKNALIALALILVMVLCALAILSFPDYHHSHRYARAFVENFRNPTPESQIALESERTRDKLLRAGFKSLFGVGFCACAFGLRRVLRKQPD